MPKSPEAPALLVLVVSEDRMLQRQLSEFFDLVGYRALQTVEPEGALAAAAAQPIDMLLVDWELAARAEWELVRQLTERHPTLFKFLLVEDPDESQLQEALEAGIDDFLLKPVGYGEVLSRLRAAARVQEFDRRAAQQGRIDALTGLLSRAAFAGHLRSQLSEHGSAAPRVACIVLDIDYFGRFGRQHGPAAADALLRQFAQELGGLRAGSEVFGCLDGDRFAAMLPGANEQTAAEWAERARDTLAAIEFKIGGANQALTVSAGIAACKTGEHADELIDRAIAALNVAKRSGRNYTIKSGQLETDPKQLVTPDKLFEQTVARNVMTPCTVFLQTSEPAAAAQALFARTRVDAIPVVDGEGCLLGVCEHVNADAAEPKQSVGDLLTQDVQTFSQQERLATLLDFFTRDSRPLAVIVEGKKPLGIVTCDSLVALSRPVTHGSLSPEQPYTDTSDYLLVPDRCPVECETT